jgi:hypothetical protein
MSPAIIAATMRSVPSASVTSATPAHSFRLFVAEPDPGLGRRCGPEAFGRDPAQGVVAADLRRDLPMPYCSPR